MGNSVTFDSLNSIELTADNTITLSAGDDDDPDGDPNNSFIIEATDDPMVFTGGNVNINPGHAVDFRDGLAIPTVNNVNIITNFACGGASLVLSFTIWQPTVSASVMEVLTCVSKRIRSSEPKVYN